MDHYEMATALLTPIWRGVPAAYKSRYRAKIWQQFEENIKSAAYTATLSRFVSNLSLKLGVRMATEDVTAVREIVQGGQDRALLKLLRDEATTCVLLVRVENEARKAEWAKRDAERQAEERSVSAWLSEDGLFGEADTTTEKGVD